MASRMDRYYSRNTVVKRRSDRNRELYRDIYATGDYSNIEAVATIDKGNEIDINKVKDLLKNREETYKRTETQIIKPKQVEVRDEQFDEPEKSYDIREILNNAKTNKNNENKYQSISNTSYDIFKDLREKRRKDIEKENATGKELRELIDTIANTSMLNSMNDEELSLDLLDDLKSTENTIVADKTSIRSVLEDAKKEEMKKQQPKPELDKSFYTSSLNFKDEDFEQLANLNTTLKKNNVLIKILLIVVGIAVAVLVIWGVFNILK